MGASRDDTGGPDGSRPLGPPRFRATRGRLGADGVGEEVDAVTDEKSRWEEVRVAGDQLVGTVKQLVHEGNVRRIIVKNEEGHTFIEIPLTVGVVGTMLLPVWAALGALAAIVAGFKIEVEKVEQAEAPDAPEETG